VHRGGLSLRSHLSPSNSPRRRPAERETRVELRGAGQGDRSACLILSRMTANYGKTSMTNGICFLTTTFAADLERFELLRRSVQLFAPEMPHVAIVNTEDIPKFTKRFGADSRLQIVRSADVLPQDIERRRRKSGPRWLTGKWLHKDLIKGWHAQQLMKLFALAGLAYESAVFMDSDVFVCRPLDPGYFYIDGRLKLFRRMASNPESFDFDISTHDILGNPLHRVTQLYDYIYSPACFRKSSAIALFAELERRHESKWLHRFLLERRPSEYNLLGYAATVLEDGRSYQIVECEPDQMHHSIRFPEDRGRYAEEIELMMRRPKPFALIQSSLGIEQQTINESFLQLAQAHRKTAD
jgi:uncharacterized protein DUF6492